MTRQTVETETEAAVEQYLTCIVGGECYGLGILNVREIRGWENVARVPNTPAYIKGILNLRGTAVPVIDMRMRMRIEHPCYDKNTVVIVVRSEICGNERIAALVVDSVSDVISVTGQEVRNTPDFGDRSDTEFIVGLVDFCGNMVMLFDVDSFMRHADIYDAPQAAGEEL